MHAGLLGTGIAYSLSRRTTCLGLLNLGCICQAVHSWRDICWVFLSCWPFQRWSQWLFLIWVTMVVFIDFGSWSLGSGVECRWWSFGPFFFANVSFKSSIRAVQEGCMFIRLSTYWGSCFIKVVSLIPSSFLDFVTRFLWVPPLDSELNLLGSWHFLHFSFFIHHTFLGYGWFFLHRWSNPDSFWWWCCSFQGVPVWVEWFTDRLVGVSLLSHHSHCSFTYALSVPRYDWSSCPSFLTCPTCTVSPDSVYGLIFPWVRL